MLPMALTNDDTDATTSAVTSFSSARKIWYRRIQLISTDSRRSKGSASIWSCNFRIRANEKKGEKMEREREGEKKNHEIHEVPFDVSHYIHNLHEDRGDFNILHLLI